MQNITTKVFVPSAQVEILDLPDGTRLVKQLARIEYLALNPAQQGIMALFDGNRTVEQALHALLGQEQHPDIRGFYDLVLTAIRRGILIEKGEPDAVRVNSGATAGRSDHRVALAIALFAAALGSVALGSMDIKPMTDLSGWLEVLLLISVGLSLGSALAAAALERFGRTAYRPRIRIDRLIPFFSIDSRDAFMGGRACEIGVAAQALMAPFLIAIAAWLTHSGGAGLAAATTLVILGFPFGTTPAHTLLHAWLRKEYELPHCADQFLKTRFLSVIFDWQTKLKEERYFLGYCTYAILWLGLTFRFINRLMEEHGRYVFQQLAQRSKGEDHSLTLAVYWLLGAALAGIIAWLVWLVLKAVHRQLAPKLFHAENRVRNTAAATRPPEPEIIRFLGETLLCGGLPKEVLPELAKSMRYMQVESGETIIRERDSGDAMFLVFQGGADVLKEDESGHEWLIAHLGRGDAFGEIALLDRVPRTSSVKASGSTGLLALSREDFDRILVTSLGSAQIRTLIQVSAFLRRNPLFAQWHPQALMQVSREFVLQDCDTGQRLIGQGQTNDSFFMVYEGEFTVTRQGQTIATLKAGDFCGEISLLKNVAATADVTASGKARCLKLQKESFLRLVSRDFLTGLTIESAVGTRTSSFQNGRAA